MQNKQEVVKSRRYAIMIYDVIGFVEKTWLGFAGSEYRDKDKKRRFLTNLISVLRKMNKDIFKGFPVQFMQLLEKKGALNTYDVKKMVFLFFFEKGFIEIPEETIQIRSSELGIIFVLMTSQQYKNITVRVYPIVEPSSSSNSSSSTAATIADGLAVSQPEEQKPEQEPTYQIVNAPKQVKKTTDALLEELLFKQETYAKLLERLLAYINILADCSCRMYYSEYNKLHYITPVEQLPDQLLYVQKEFNILERMFSKTLDQFESCIRNNKCCLRGWFKQDDEGWPIRMNEE